jgi:hypothetical protein
VRNVASAIMWRRAQKAALNGHEAVILRHITRTATARDKWPTTRSSPAGGGVTGLIDGQSGHSWRFSYVAFQTRSIAAGQPLLGPTPHNYRRHITHRAPIEGRTRSRVWTPPIRRLAASVTCQFRY